MIHRILETLSRLSSIFRRRGLDQDFDEELSGHIEMLMQENQAHGLSPDEARRQAILRVGGLNAIRDLHRDARGVPVLENVFHASLLDFKLGARMLLKYPGLSLVGGLGMAVAIAVGAGVFDVTANLFYPTLPLDEGERVIAIRNRDIAANEAETQSVHDFVTWRDALKSVEDIGGAYRTRGRNLILSDAPAEHVATAEVSASMFRVARVPALLGRPILDEDERQAAPAVVVIGYDVWRSRFASDPAVLGRDIRLGNIVHKNNRRHA